MRVLLFLVASLMFVPGAASAADLANFMNREPVNQIRTEKRLYDVERCIINAEGPSMPFVYRQPDQPERVIIVWDIVWDARSIGGVSAAVELNGLANTELRFWGRERIMRRIRPCIEG